jgi:hypothetical protein
MSDQSLHLETEQIPDHIGIMMVFCDQKGRPIRQRIMRLALFLRLR